MAPFPSPSTLRSLRASRWQFRLRTLLVVTALAAMLFAWHREVLRQIASVENLLGSNPNAGVYFAHQFDEQGKLNRDAPAPGPAWLNRWAGGSYLASVTRVELQYATDTELRSVAQFSNLERLTLVRAVDVTDEGLAQLRGLKKLRVLQLYDADMLTDAGLDQLAQLRGLQYLTLGPLPRHVTAAALARLRSALPHCQVDVTNEEGDERQLLSHGEIG
jgi:hypothetical protein